MTKKTEFSQYPHNSEISTRWMDNDVYGHVNNVQYYSFFDTAVNRYLVEAGVLDFLQGDTIGLVVETGCNYFAPLAFPDTVVAGVGVEHIGNSSVRYRIGLFRKGDSEPAAQGFFVHVYVDSESRRPTSIPNDMRKALEAISFSD